jgi:hypothetical protein
MSHTVSVEKAVNNRIKALIEKGMPLSPAGKKGYALTFEEEQAISGWLTSAMHAVELVVGSSLSAYTSQCNRILAAYSSSKVLPPSRLGSAKSECVGQLVSVLENLLADIEAGLISSLEDRIRAETFDDFLDHAVQYHKAKRKESGVIAGVVFEDTIRRIAKNNGVSARKLETIINELAKKNVLTATKAKRAKVGAHVRTKATHALWEEFDLKDVSDTINFTRELIATHLDH